MLVRVLRRPRASCRHFANAGSNSVDQPPFSLGSCCVLFIFLSIAPESDVEDGNFSDFVRRGSLSMAHIGGTTSSCRQTRQAGVRCGDAPPCLPVAFVI